MAPSAATRMAYGWVYPDPKGSVLTPALIGVDQAGLLPDAATFCGKRESVCPVKIPLPGLMRHWHEREFEGHLTPAAARWGPGVWGFVAHRPALHRLMTRAAAATLGWAASAASFSRCHWLAARSPAATCPPRGRYLLRALRQGPVPPQPLPLSRLPSPPCGGLAPASTSLLSPPTPVRKYPASSGHKCAPCRDNPESRPFRPASY